MPDFEKMYFHMAGKITDIIETLDELSAQLKEVQRQGEDMYIEDNELVENNNT